MSARWVDDLLRPAVLCILFGALALSSVSLARLFLPSWEGGYLVPFYGLTAIEAYFSQRHSPRRAHAATRRMLELSLLCLAFLLWSGAVRTGTPLPNGALQLDWVNAGLFVPALVVWRVARKTTLDLERIGEAPDGDVAYASPPTRLARRFLVGGVLLVGATVLTQEPLVGLLKSSDRSTHPVLQVFLYFLVGAVLLGQIRYAALQRRWDGYDGATAPGIDRVWILALLGVVALAAAAGVLLTDAGTNLTGATGRAVAKPILTVTIHNLALSKHLVVQLLSLTHLRLRAPHLVHPPRNIHISLPISVSNPPHHLQSGHGATHHGHGSSSSASWPQRLGAVLPRLLPLVAGVLVLYAVLARRARPLAAGERLAGVIRRLHAGWKAGVTALLRWRRVIGTYLPSGFSPPSLAPSELLRLGENRTVTPRGQIIHYYLQAVHQAGRSLLPRRPSQTPREYEDAIAGRLAMAAGEMHDLTEAFIEARYSRHELDEDQARQARSGWRRLRAAMRRMEG